jgi:hypothetical protein
MAPESKRAVGYFPEREYTLGPSPFPARPSGEALLEAAGTARGGESRGGCAVVLVGSQPGRTEPPAAARTRLCWAKPTRLAALAAGCPGPRAGNFRGESHNKAGRRPGRFGVGAVRCPDRPSGRESRGEASPERSSGMPTAGGGAQRSRVLPATSRENRRSGAPKIEVTHRRIGWFVPG